MNKTLFTLVCLCILGMSGQALAQTTSTSGSSTSSTTQVAFPVEQFIFGNMTTQQQNNYMQSLLITNLATQVVTAAAYSNAERKLRNSDTLTDFDKLILARGPFALLPGNQSLVTIGTPSTSSSSSSTGTAGTTGTTGTTGTSGTSAF